MFSVGADASAALAVVGGVAGVGSAVVVGVVLFGVVAIGVDLAAAAGVLTVVDELTQASVGAWSGLVMVVVVELSSSKNFSVVTKCRE